MWRVVCISFFYFLFSNRGTVIICSKMMRLVAFIMLSDAESISLVAEVILRYIMRAICPSMLCLHVIVVAETKRKQNNSCSSIHSILFAVSFHIF